MTAPAEAGICADLGAPVTSAGGLGMDTSYSLHNPGLATAARRSSASTQKRLPGAATGPLWRFVYHILHGHPGRRSMKVGPAPEARPTERAAAAAAVDAIPPIVDLDAHVVEPADVWSSRLPARYRDVGPR